MIESEMSKQSPDDAGRQEMWSALFAQLVMQQANLAMMLLGKGAHPESGQVTKDLEAARLFINQLEMLEIKTKGNLSQEEAKLLKQSLMSLRLAFVESVDSPAPKSAEQSPSPPPASSSASTQPGQAVPAAEEEEQRKKFSKKY